MGIDDQHGQLVKKKAETVRKAEASIQDAVLPDGTFVLKIQKQRGLS